MENIAPQIDAACEGDWSVDKCLEVGERIWNMERVYNNAAGFTADDDKLPKRLLKEAIKSGPTKGQVNRLGEMLPKYYEIRGWTQQGVPTPETLSRLGL
jgi:aldehyde:ferredoxin oxidoreductase